MAVWFGLLGVVPLLALALYLVRRTTLQTELRVLGDSFDAPVLVLDRGGKVTDFNERLRRMCQSLLVPAPEAGVAVSDMLRDWASASALESASTPLMALALGKTDEPVECVLVGQTYRVARVILTQQRSALVLHDVSARVRLESALSSSEAARTALLNAAPVPMLLTSPVSGEIVEANQQAARLLGFERAAELVGISINQFHMDPLLRERMLEQLRHNGRADNAELSLRDRNGEVLWVLASSRAIDVGNQRLILSAANDVSRLKRVEAALRKSEKHLRALLERTPIPILILDTATRQVLFDNMQARLEFGGSDKATRVGQPMPDFFVQAADRDAVAAELARAELIEARELQLRRADGAVLWFYFSAVKVEYEGRDAVLYSMLDINERHQIETQLELARVEAEMANRELRVVNVELEQQASTDRLTEAFNRRHCEEMTLREMSRARRYCLPLSVIMFDIDHFKRINDTYGHAVGDSVLIELVKLMRTHLRSSDVLARWGGEEFVVVAPSVLDEAATLATKLLELVRAYAFTEVGQVTVSAGVSCLNYRDTLDSLMRRVDRALYDAKESGRDRVCILGPDALGVPHPED